MTLAILSKGLRTLCLAAALLGMTLSPSAQAQMRDEFDSEPPPVNIPGNPSSLPGFNADGSFGPAPCSDCPSTDLCYRPPPGPRSYGGTHCYPKGDINGTLIAGNNGQGQGNFGKWRQRDVSNRYARKKLNQQYATRNGSTRVKVGAAYAQSRGLRPFQFGQPNSNVGSKFFGAATSARAGGAAARSAGSRGARSSTGKSHYAHSSSRRTGKNTP